MENDVKQSTTLVVLLYTSGQQEVSFVLYKGHVSIVVGKVWPCSPLSALHVKEKSILAVVLVIVAPYNKRVKNSRAGQCSVFCA